MIQYVVYRGEYPFNEPFDVVDAPEDRPDIALETAKLLHSRSPDFFVRHPVVEPL